MPTQTVAPSRSSRGNARSRSRTTSSRTVAAPADSNPAPVGSPVPIAACRSPSAQQRALDLDREQQRRARRELAQVHVPAPRARGPHRRAGRRRGRHADAPDRGPQRHRERSVHGDRAVVDGQLAHACRVDPVAERADVGHPRRPGPVDPDVEDLDAQRVAGACPGHRDRPRDAVHLLHPDLLQGLAGREPRVGLVARLERDDGAGIHLQRGRRVLVEAGLGVVGGQRDRCRHAYPRV